MIHIIKNTFIIFTTLYIFTKALKLETNKKKYLLFIVISILTSLFSLCINYYVKGLDTYTTIILITFSLTYLYYQRFDFTIFVCIISYVISLFISLFSVVITSIPLYFLMKVIKLNSFFEIIHSLIIGLTSILLSIIIFKFKHLRDGIQFLKNKDFSETGFVLSILIIFVYTFFRFRQTESSSAIVAIIFTILLLGIILIFRMRYQNNNLYIQNTYERSINALNYQLKLEKQKYIEISEQNMELGKIIHRARKLIPAIELANTRDKQHSISSMNNFQADAIINYMHKKSTDYNINFSFKLNGDENKLIDKIVSEEYLCTIIADLLENAIIATKSVNLRNISLIIMCLPTEYSITVLDSGDYFSKEVIKRLGKVPYTTHKKEGGTGFGLKTIFDINKKLNASFFLDEKINDTNFTKSIKIVFDNKGIVSYNTQ